MALKFDPDKPVVVTFLSGQAEEVKGNFGLQYLYKVEVGGTKDDLYATGNLHKVLQKTGVQGGSYVRITKRGNGVKTFWEVEPVADPPSSGTASRPPTQQQDPDPEQSPSGSEALAGGVFGLMARCLRESHKAWLWLGFDFSPDNVQGTASTLFIACKERGIVLPPVPYPDQEQMLALARIGDEIVPEQKERLEKKVAEGITWAEAQAIIDYYEEKQGKARTAA